MKTLKLMCGLPRSGKSTWIAENKTNEVVVSADDLRPLVYNQRFWKDGEPMMWAIRGYLLKYLLKQGVDIIVDETNINDRFRSATIILAKEYGYTVDAYVMLTPEDVCIERAIATNQEDLIPVIKKMTSQFSTPVHAEGINEIHMI